MAKMSWEKLVFTLKSKLKSLKSKKSPSDLVYNKIDKSESMRIEIQSRKAKKLISDTLKIADSPKTRTYAF